DRGACGWRARADRAGDLDGRPELHRRRVPGRHPRWDGHAARHGDRGAADRYAVGGGRDGHEHQHGEGRAAAVRGRLPAAPAARPDRRAVARARGGMMPSRRSPLSLLAALVPFAVLAFAPLYLAPYHLLLAGRFLSLGILAMGIVM